MKRKEYPSQKKYRTNNPAITFRLKKEDRAKLNVIIKGSGKLLSEWMTDFIHEKMDLNGETSKLVAKINALEQKNKVLETIERFSVPCPVCEDPLKFSSKRPNWTPTVQPILKKAFSNWHHVPPCKPKPSPPTNKIS